MRTSLRSRKKTARRTKRSWPVRPVLVVLVLACLFAPRTVPAQVDLPALDAYIGKAVKDFNLTGLAIAVVKDDRVVFSKGYGYKNVETRAAITTRSLFNIASCSKAFTAACLAMLVDEGKLRWQDKVVDYVPGFRLADAYITERLNMRDMLSHRSGLGTFYGDLLWYETSYSHEEIIRRMRYLPIRNEFRSQFGYQNNMYMIAGEIVARVAGKSWSQFVYDRIFRPLGMSDSRTSSKDLSQNQDIAYPHLQGKLQQIYIQEPFAAGSIYSSVDDMSRWIRMLLNEGRWQGKTILSPASVEELFSPQTIIKLSPFMKSHGSHFYTYGLGWFLFDYAGRKIVEHDGGMPGYISKVTLVPEEELGLVILTNDMNILTGALRYKILDTFLGQKDTDWAAQYLMFKKQREEARKTREAERSAQRVAGTEPSQALAEYAGTYRDEMYGDARVDFDGEKLQVTLLPAAEKFTSKMEHWHYDTFRIKFRDAFLPAGFVTFHLDSKGQIANFTIDLPNPDFHFFNLDFKRVTD